MGTSVHRTREERTGTDEGLTERGKEKRRNRQEKKEVTTGQASDSKLLFLFCFLLK